MLQAWTTQSIAPQDRYDFVVDTINATVCACAVECDIAADRYEAQLEHVDLGMVSMLRYTSIGTQIANRTQRHVRTDNDDSVLLYLPLSAGMAVDQADQTTHIKTGTMSLFDLGQPLKGYFVGGEGDLTAAINIRIPATLLRAREPRITGLFRRPLTLGRGSGRLMMSLISMAIDEGPHIAEAAAAPLGHAIVDAVCSVAAEAMSDGTMLPGRQDSRALSRQRIVDFIQARMSDPDLSVEEIARVLNMSVRCVHRAFEGSGETAAGYIREQRLQRCRAELCDPAMRGLAVAQIAYSWGFKDVAHFSRAYKSRFGVPPSVDRQRSYS